MSKEKSPKIDTSATQKYLETIEAKNKLDADRAIKEHAKKNPIYPVTQFIGRHPILIGGLATGAIAFAVIFSPHKSSSNEEARQSSLPEVTSRPTATTTSAHSSTSMPTEVTTSTTKISIAGPRDPNSTIDIRKPYGIGSDKYTREDLLQRLPRKINTCSEQEQQIFNDTSKQLESIANSPRFFAAFPAGYDPADRVATSLGACVEFYDGIDTTNVANDINYWFPVNEFNAEQLSLLSLSKVCPQYAN